MKRANSTEATVEKVELKTELDSLKPIEPKDVIDFKVDEEAPAVEDPIEILKIFLKLNEYKWWLKKFLKARWYQILKDENDKEIVIRDWQIVKDLVYDIFDRLYNHKSAFIKRWEYVLFGEVVVRDYKIKVCTKFGNVMFPNMTVDWTTIYFPRNNVLSSDELEAYKMYNQKKEDYNKMELEKKIMADLIAYSQLWTKTLEESSELIDRIKKDLEAIGTVEYCGFKNGEFIIKFPFRMGTDNSKKYAPMVLSPLEIRINFKDKYIHTMGEHPHNLWWSPCLWGELARLKDQCFRDWDIHWIIIGMTQFWNSFTSDDCGHWDRDPACCLRRYISWMSFEEILAIKIPFEEIFRTIARYDINRFTYKYTAFVDKCKEDKDFLRLLLWVLSREWQYYLLKWLGFTEDEVAKYRQDWSLDKEDIQITSGYRFDEWFNEDGDDYEEDWDEDEDEDE